MCRANSALKNRVREHLDVQATQLLDQYQLWKSRSSVQRVSGGVVPVGQVNNSGASRAISGPAKAISVKLPAWGCSKSKARKLVNFLVQSAHRAGVPMETLIIKLRMSKSTFYRRVKKGPANEQEHDRIVAELQELLRASKDLPKF